MSETNQWKAESEQLRWWKESKTSWRRQSDQIRGEKTFTSNNFPLHQDRRLMAPNLSEISQSPPRKGQRRHQSSRKSRINGRHPDCYGGSSRERIISSITLKMTAFIHSHALGVVSPWQGGSRSATHHWSIKSQDSCYYWESLSGTTLKTLISATVMATSLALPTIAKPTIPDGYEFMNYSDNNTLYFGRIRVENGDEVVLSRYIITADDKTDTYISRINCRDRTLLYGGEWQAYPKGKLGYGWIEFACRNHKLWKPWQKNVLLQCGRIRIKFLVFIADDFRIIINHFHALINTEIVCCPIEFWWRLLASAIKITNSWKGLSLQNRKIVIVKSNGKRASHPFDPDISGFTSYSTLLWALQNQRSSVPILSNSRSRSEGARGN